MRNQFQITIISDGDSWINEYIPKLITLLELNHLVTWKHHISEIPIGDFVFYLGCGQIVSPLVLQRNRHNLVIHESALPQGKGWSPLTWQILEGKNQIPITLFEAISEVDSGDIYVQKIMYFEGTELIDELRKKQGEMTIQLCLEFVHHYPEVLSQAKAQQGDSTFYRRRKPEDSCLDVDKSLREQFNLLRVVDNDRYPAYFEFNGKRYIVKIETWQD